MTKQKRKKFFYSILYAVLLYAACFLAAMVCVHLLHFNAYKSMKENVSLGASSLSENGNLDGEFDHMHTGIYMYANGEVSGLQGYESLAYENYTRFVHRYDRFCNDGKVNYTIAFSFSPPYFTAVSSAPVYADGKFCGELFMVKGVRYTPAVLYTCLIGYTAAFILIYISSIIVHRKNEKINEIYRCYVANISHELKSPIASIYAIAETLNEGLALSEESKVRFYGMITREARNLERTVKDIMELSKIQEKRIDFSKSIVEINSIITPVLDTYIPRCQDIDIHLSVDDSIWNVRPLYTNKEEINRLFSILLDNAMKYTGHDSEGIIRISAESKEKYAVFCISDNGTGIRKEALPHIFERFYKDNSSRNQSGSGLGLSIAKEIVSALGEEIYVESKPGTGARFYFTIHFAGCNRHTLLHIKKRQ